MGRDVVPRPLLRSGSMSGLANGMLHQLRGNTQQVVQDTGLGGSSKGGGRGAVSRRDGLACTWAQFITVAKNITTVTATSADAEGPKYLSTCPLTW